MVRKDKPCGVIVDNICPCDLKFNFNCRYCLNREFKIPKGEDWFPILKEKY